MKIDTLLLSGGSTKGLAYPGVIKSLIDNKILDFNTLKHVITASAGSIMVIPFLFKKDFNVVIKIFLKINFKIVDINDFNVQSLLKDFGCFENNKIETCIKIICKHFAKNENLTLKEFYEITNIKYTVKVLNVSKKIVEYINYENYPDMPLYLLVKMATAVPFILKPVPYENYLYLDGATNVGLPFEYLKIHNIKKNYLGVIVSNKKNKKEIIEGCEKPLDNLLQYLHNIYEIYHYYNEQITFIKNKNIIFIYLNKQISFEIDEDEKKKFILEGYKQTEKHIKKYFNDS